MDGFSNFDFVLWGFLATLVVSALIVVTKPYHRKLSLDDMDGVQKFHSTPTPRIGGVALLAGLVVTWLAQTGETKALFGWVFLAVSPVLAFGLAEDITNKISVKVRLVATLSAGVLFVLLTGSSIEKVYVWWFDFLLANPVFSIAFTAFAIASATNALNIIDGFHGLASGTVLLMLASICIVAWGAGDVVLFNITLSILAVTGGFFVVNFPFGKLFLGDGGAYTLGFLVAALTVLIPARNPEISPWISPLILSYPLTELVVSISRKIRRKGHHPGQPDSFHLHMLVHKFYAHRLPEKLQAESIRHALTSLTLWIFPISSLILVSLSGFTADFAIRSIIGIFIGYLIIYFLAQRKNLD